MLLLITVLTYLCILYDDAPFARTSFPVSLCYDPIYPVFDVWQYISLQPGSIILQVSVFVTFLQNIMGKVVTTASRFSFPRAPARATRPPSKPTQSQRTAGIRRSNSPPAANSVWPSPFSTPTRPLSPPATSHFLHVDPQLSPLRSEFVTPNTQQKDTKDRGRPQRLHFSSRHTEVHQTDGGH